MKQPLPVFIMLAICAGAPAGETLPDGYRLSRYRAPTPALLPGATVLPTAALTSLLQHENVVLLDVYPANKVADGNGWRWVPDTPRYNLPGSVWLPNVGYGDLAAPMQDWFASQLQALSQQQLDAGLVFYCKRDCWMSWNAGRRAVLLGYRHVYWYPDGSDGWQEAGQPLQLATPQPLPRAL